MTDLPPFSLRHECPKCGEQAFLWEHRKTIDSRGNPFGQEVLILTCSRCGWAFAMRTKDAP